MTQPTATSTSSLAYPNAYTAMAFSRMAENRWGAPGNTPDVIGTFGATLVSGHDMRVATWLVPAPADHPNLAPIEAAMRRWNDAWVSFQALVTSFHPVHQPGVVSGRGCTSGHAIEGGRRIVYVTVGDVEGCREGLLHEMAHLRLRALGIDMEEHDGTLLRNPSPERFVSPVRKDVLRPMSAVVHGFYAWLMMSHGDLVALSHGKRDDVIGFLRTNAPKLEEGILTLGAHARWTERGGHFSAALISWARIVADEMWAEIGAEKDAVMAAHRAWVRTQPVCNSPLYDAEVA